jgi:hypothetical protein
MQPVEIVSSALKRKIRHRIDRPGSIFFGLGSKFILDKRMWIRARVSCDQNVFKKGILDGSLLYC